MKKPFLIIQIRENDKAANSEFDSFLKYGQLASNEVERIRIEQGPLPDIDLNDYSGIIVGGSPFDISTPQEQKSEIQVRVEEDFSKLLSKVTPQDFPFFGSLFG